MNSEFKIIKNYRDDDLLRKDFSRLSKKVFSLDFEDWYQNGYWGDDYIPYSIIADGKIVANVSVNIIDMVREGVVRHYIQLGTVMTDEAYRNRGFIRKLMAEIEKDYSDKTDGFFLFANDRALDFYPKFGFKKAVEYQYSKEVCVTTERTAVTVSMKNKAEWGILEQAVIDSVPDGSFAMANNEGLIMFYVTKFMRDNVYYIEDNDAYVIAEEEGGGLFIHNVFARQPVDLDKVVSAFGSGISRVTLGFTPQDSSGYTVSVLNEDDTTLFIKGKIEDVFKDAGVMFPTLSHA